MNTPLTSSAIERLFPFYQSVVSHKTSTIEIQDVNYMNEKLVTRFPVLNFRPFIHSTYQNNCHRREKKKKGNAENSSRQYFLTHTAPNCHLLRFYRCAGLTV